MPRKFLYSMQPGQCLEYSVSCYCNGIEIIFYHCCSSNTSHGTSFCVEGRMGWFRCVIPMHGKFVKHLFLDEMYT